MSLWLQAAAVAGGGAMGALARWSVYQLARQFTAWPMFATLSVNVLGCFAAGCLLAWLETRSQAPAVLRSLLMTGVLGAFTTFSAFGADVLHLFRAGRPGWAIAYVAASVVLSLLAVFAGWSLLRR